MGTFRSKLFAAFAAVVVLAALVWFIAVDLVIERAVERKGTETVGALVEVESADLALFPMGLTLTGVQVTNPNRPMTNAIEAKSISFTLDGRMLLSSKVHIDDMLVEGVRLGTPRRTSGAVAGARPAVPVPEPPAGGFSLPAFTMPDPAKILASEELATAGEIKALSSDIKSSRLRWDTRVEGLLDRAKIDGFRKRAEAIKAAGGSGPMGMISVAGEAAALQKDIRAYVSGLESATRDLRAEIGGYRERIEALKAAPGKDASRLMKKYGLTTEGVGNLSRLVFGPAVAGWVEPAMAWYERLAVQAGNGAAGEAPEEAAGEPRFLIKKALVTVDLLGGTVEGTLKDFTTEQQPRGRPATMVFTGRGLKGLVSLRLDGVFDRTVPARPSDSVSLDIKGLELGGVELIDSGGLAAALTKAKADISVEVVIGRGAGGAAGRGGGPVEGTLRAVFDPVVIDARAGKDRLSKILAGTLSGIKSFDLRAGISGTLDDYDMTLSSDMDRLLSAAVDGLVRDEAARLEGRLTREIRARTEGQRADLRRRLEGLGLLAGKLASRRSIADEILSGIGPGGPGGIKLPF